MTVEDFEARLYDVPFKPFRIRLSNSEVVDVTNSGEVMPGDTSAIVPFTFRRDDKGVKRAATFRKVAYSHMVEFQDIDVKGDIKRRKK